MASSPPSLSRFEADLLRVLHALLLGVRAQAQPLLTRSQPRPPCLSRECVDLVRDTLAKGCTRLLIHAGGWRRERHLRGGQAREGRIWERSTPAELSLNFSASALDFLMWLTSENVARDVTWRPENHTALTPGDRLLFHLALSAVHDSPIGRRWCAAPPLAEDALAALMYPAAFAATEAEHSWDFAPWLTPSAARLLEALQPLLLERLIEIEQAKRRIISVDVMRQLGRVQHQALSAYLDAVDRHGRRDLARCVLLAARKLLKDSPQLSNWVASLSVGNLRLADRADAYRSALAFLELLPILRGWQQQALGVGYFDEGYAAAQLWKSDWERYDGEQTCAAAHEIVRQAQVL